jgi:formylglycine-generating enzyme required for sulfatase activity
MSSRRLLFASFLVASLAANTALAEPPAPKDGPLGMKFAALPKATFYMGWDGKNKGKKTEIKEEFEIAVHTVTQEQWHAIIGNNPSEFSREVGGKDRVKDIRDADLKQFPVENVSWDDAQEFIKMLNEKEAGRGYVYRLPGEAEWKYACRGGATSEEECSYHFYFAKPTKALSSDQANIHGNFPFGKTDKGPCKERPTKVGSYAPNKLGLYDMHGNVWQWCEDLSDPKGLDRVVRGGSWFNDGSYCQAANGSRYAPSNRYSDLGLRLARTPSGAKHPMEPADRPSLAEPSSVWAGWRLAIGLGVATLVAIALLSWLVGMRSCRGDKAQAP